MKNHTYLRVLNFVKQYQADHGLSPAYKDIAEGVGLASSSTVAHHLEQLEAMGKITRARINGRVVSRQIEVIEEPF